MKIKRKTLHKLRTWTFIILGVSLFLFAFNLYYRTPVFTITAYRLDGLQGEDVESIVKDLTDQSSNYSYFLFPNNKILTYSKDAIRSILVAHVPDIKSIRIRPDGMHVLHITVTRNEPLFRIDEGKAITEGGLIFTTTKDLSTLPILSVASSTQVPLKMNELVFSQLPGIDGKLLGSIKNFQTKVSTVLFPVHAIVIDQNDDISFIDERGVSTVLFTKETDEEKAWSTLLSAIDTEPLKGKLRTDLSSLLYLDIRFGNKVFYKFGSIAASSSAVIIENHDLLPEEATSTTQ